MRKFGKIFLKANKKPHVVVCAGESLSEVVLPPAGVAEKHTLNALQQFHSGSLKGHRQIQPLLITGKYQVVSNPLCQSGSVCVFVHINPCVCGSLRAAVFSMFVAFSFIHVQTGMLSAVGFCVHTHTHTLGHTLL